MRVTPVSVRNNRSNNRNFSKQNVSTNPVNVTFSSAFDDSYRLVLDSKKFNILYETTEELKKLAEIFHLEDTRDLCETRYSGLIFKHADKVRRAQEIFEPYVAVVRENKKKITERVDVLLGKHLIGIDNKADQKFNVGREYLLRLEAEQNGAVNDAKIPNGILIWGPSNEKDVFVEWIRNQAKALYKEINYDHKAPFESIQRIVDTAKNAETVYKLNNLRTLLTVKNLDRLLSDTQSQESRKAIARFKAFSENLEKNYHTTIMTKTDMPLDKLEQAAIGPQRFTLKVKLNDGITEAEKYELQAHQTELKRLADMAEQKNHYYKEVFYPDYDPDRYM